MPQTKFKVGDYIRIITHDLYGETGTVISIAQGFSWGEKIYEILTRENSTYRLFDSEIIQYQD